MAVDVCAFRPERASGGPAPQLLADPLDSGRTCSGQEKVGQRFLLHLLTRLGSVPGAPNSGSEFVDRLLAGKASTEMDVFVAFTSSLGTVVRNLKAEESADDPGEERLAGVRVNSLRLAPGSVVLEVRLRFEAGEALPLSVPLNFLLG